MESRGQMHQPTRKHSEEPTCAICVEKIDYYGIGECGHNMVCWRCIMKQRMKMDKKECPICKQQNSKVLITKYIHETLATCPDPIYDKESDVYYSTPAAKGDILLQIGNYCKLCSTEEMRRKFPTTKSLLDHYDNYHKKALCEKCLEFKPVLMYEQELFEYKQFQHHMKRVHPICFFCNFLHFYDQDNLNRHYLKDHHFCDICKKQGKKRNMEKNKYTNLPEYEVYKDFTELRDHHTKRHFTCEFKQEYCLNLVFEDGPQLASHYFNVHGIRKEVRVEFGFSDDEDVDDRFQHEEEKKENAQLTKDNYREVFPTLTQSKKQIMAEAGIQEREQWPSLIQQIVKKPNISVMKAVQDKQSHLMESARVKKEKQDYHKMIRQIDNEDLSLEFNEAANTLQFTQIEEVPKIVSNNTGKKKMKKVIVVEERKHEEIKKSDFPQLIQEESKRPQTQQQINRSGINDNTWNVVSENKIAGNTNKTKPNNNSIQQQTSQNFSKGVDQKFKQEFPTLHKQENGKKPVVQDPGTSARGDGGGGYDPQNANGAAAEVKKKNRKKKDKGEAVVDWTKLNKQIDYKQLF
ncbi:potential zinc ring finger protein [Stylonychia lemnae]|uniref:Potential zinc ring finger protein n=1 Tax=Stylonychia lemnae TaxID=5949 RepID=A0A077ZXQ1_STYLE|nr:potential zinc ring finger protein [Stylonychia lemnae]|eukprot:CDW74696.1 potential zinc ring finger protein [Stylonychia lemnae]